MNIATVPQASENERARLVRLGSTEDDFAADVRRGLTSHPKTISSKYFYDDLGLILFEAVCRVPEYYVGRAEEEILASRSHEIVQIVGQPIRLVELGSGSAKKTRALIRSLLPGQQHLEYVPIDTDLTSLIAASDALVAEFKALSVTALAGTLEAGIDHLGRDSSATAERTLVLFLGTTVGNFESAQRRDLLRSLRGVLHPGDGILLGADSVKSAEILVPAYDDALGVTAAFNRNLLVRMNRELDGTFDLATFKHFALYDTNLERTEMHLVSTVQQSVRVAGIEVHFAEGESIHTENSYKFTPAKIKAIAKECEFELTAQWSDARNLFSDYLLTAI